MPDAVLTELIDEWAKWEQLTKEAKAEIEKIKAKIQKIAVRRLRFPSLKRSVISGPIIISSRSASLNH
jgi:hypothetical protein